MKKILVVTSLYAPYIGGGAERATQLYVNLLKENGYDVSVLTIGEKNSIDIVDDVKVYRFCIDDRYKTILAQVKNKYDKESSIFNKLFYKITDIIYNKTMYNFYYRFFKENNYDVIHTSNNMIYFGLYNCWKAAKDCNIRLIHTLHDSSLINLRVVKKTFLIDKIWRQINKKNIRLVDVVLSPSKYMINIHQSNLGKFKEEYIVPNFIEDFEEKICNIDKKRNQIIYVGNLGNHKGVRELIDAFNLINNKDIDLIIVGDGELYKELNEQYTKNKNIILTGWLEKADVIEYVKQSKILILPSQCDEAFGMVLIEAILNNTIAIGSNKGAIPEVLFNDDDLIFDSTDYEKLGALIEKYINLNNQQYIKKLKEIKIKSMIYTKQNISDELKKILEYN